MISGATSALIVVMDCGLAPTKSAVADLVIPMPISDKPRSVGAPE
jgi:hypothetical protein